MTKARFTEEFKEEAVKQVIERGYTVPDVASDWAYLPPIYTYEAQILALVNEVDYIWRLYKS